MHYKRQLITVLFTVLFLLGLISLFSTTAQAKTRHIKVGYFDYGEYFSKDYEGHITSYDTTFLNKISEYMDCTYEFVDCNNFNQATKMLQEHKIDLLGTLQKTPAREKEYAFCQKSYGITVAELLAFPIKHYVFEDYDAIGASTIGVVKDYVRLDELKALLKQHNISPKFRYYKTQDELYKAMSEGKVDLVASNSHGADKDWDIIEKYNYSPFYFATWKGNEQLVNEIDRALLKINLYDSEFDDATLKQYFPALVNFPFTKEELEVIAEAKTFTLYFDSNTAPLSWKDPKTGEMKGAFIDICNKLQTLTGLHFVYRPLSSRSVKMGPQDVTYQTNLYSADTYNSQKNITNSILDSPFSMYYKIGTNLSLDSSTKYTISIPNDRNNIHSYIQIRYPNCTIQERQTPQDCIDDVLSGKSDMTFLSNYVAQNIFIKEDISSIVALPTETTKIGVSLQFHNEKSALLTGIIDKGIRLLDSGDVNSILMQYASNATPDITFHYFVHKNGTLLLIMIVALLVVLAIAAVSMTYAIVIKKQRARIEAAIASKSEFFARMSHDMRTPMNGILGIAALTEDEDNIDNLRNDIMKIKESGEYMLNLINDTLDIQRTESGRIQIESTIFNVNDFLSTLKSMVMPSANEKNIHFVIYRNDIDDECYVRADAIHLKQIFINLISNAIKFTPKNGTVTLDIRTLYRKGNQSHCQFKVTDTGVGMSEDFISNHIFQPFSQEYNPMTANYSGSGLGLSIVKNLVEAMHGHIEVSSRQNIGTTFCFELDLTVCSQEEVNDFLKKSRQKSSHNKVSLNQKRVLLCEDHPINAEITKRLLAKENCQTDWAENGQIGLSMFENSELGYYDCILMDIRMPVMDGLETTVAIRKLDRADAKSIAIIAMSANAFEEDVQKSMEAGMNAHIAKPVEPQELLDVMSEFI